MEKVITLEQANQRIDQFLKKETEYSRSKIQMMIEKKAILVNQQATKNGYILKEGDQLTIVPFKEEVMEVVPEEMELDIVYEDDALLVINKANGVVVHPGAGNFHGTLVNGLLHYGKQLSGINGTFRPGIVHRIDADTTGLLMVAKTDSAHEALAQQLEQKTTHRKYIALVWGIVMSDTGTIDAPIGRDPKDRKKMAVVAGGKHAITHFKVLKRYTNTTLLEVVLETGRTHQIRVHMNYIGHPVVNDPVYGKKKLFDETGQCLHAAELGFVHPTTGKYLEFKSPLPDSFLSILEQVKDL